MARLGRCAALALLPLLLAVGCGDKRMSLTEGAVAKESSLEVRIGGAGESGKTTVGLQAMIMPGVALMAAETNIAGVTSTKPEKPVDRQAVQGVWASLMNGLPKHLPEGDSFSIEGRLGGKLVLQTTTTVAGAQNSEVLKPVVDKLLTLAKTTHGEQAALADTAWQAASKAP